MTSYHLWHILLVRSKWKIRPFKGEYYTGYAYQEIGTIGAILESVCHICVNADMPIRYTSNFIEWPVKCMTLESKNISRLKIRILESLVSGIYTNWL